MCDQIWTKSFPGKSWKLWGLSRRGSGAFSALWGPCPWGIKVTRVRVSHSWIFFWQMLPSQPSVLQRSGRTSKSPRPNLKPFKAPTRGKMKKDWVRTHDSCKTQLKRSTVKLSIPSKRFQYVSSQKLPSRQALNQDSGLGCPCCCATLFLKLFKTSLDWARSLLILRPRTLLSETCPAPFPITRSFNLSVLIIADVAPCSSFCRHFLTRFRCASGRAELRNLLRAFARPLLRPEVLCFWNIQGYWGNCLVEAVLDTWGVAPQSDIAKGWISSLHYCWWSMKTRSDWLVPVAVGFTVLQERKLDLCLGPELPQITIWIVYG